ncbi:ATP-binding protein [Paraglaciecola sp. 20A4]|nr:ATP-binding protein [Paraglaciecola sp. 20A4]
MFHLLTKPYEKTNVLIVTNLKFTEWSKVHVYSNVTAVLVSW